MSIGVGHGGQMVHTCGRCSEEIPHRRHYCREHYQQALAEYQARLVDYERDLDEWNSLSSEERSAANRDAESSTILGFAAFLGAILGGGVWAYLYHTMKLDALYGLMIVAAGGTSLAIIPPVRYLAGKLMRATMFALLNVVVLSAIVWLLGKMSNVVETHWPAFFIGAACVGTIAAVLRELLGHHHASAAPIKPTPPSA